MITVRQIRSDEWREVKALRLRALADAPYAFSSDLATEEQYSDAIWQNRTAENALGQQSTCALGFADEQLVGMAVGIRDTVDNTVVHLFAVWVDPKCRGTNAAHSLIDFIGNWARAGGATILRSAVTEHNLRGIAFYKKKGFEILAERHPWPPDPTKFEVDISLALM